MVASLPGCPIHSNPKNSWAVRVVMKKTNQTDGRLFIRNKRQEQVPVLPKENLI